MALQLPSFEALGPQVRKQIRRLRRGRVRRERQEEIDSGRLTLTHLPAHVSIEMTARCNLECVHCRRFHFQEELSDKRGVYGEETVTDIVGSSGYLDPQVFAKCLDLVQDAESVELAGYGEPMMNPHFHDYVRELKRRGHHVNTITNGTLLTEANVEKLVENRFDLVSVSIDGYEHETLRIVRGLDRDLLFEGLERLKRAKEARGLGRNDAPRLSASFVMARFNIREMPALVRHLNELGLWSFYAQNLEVVDSADVLGCHLLHTDEAAREETARIIKVTEQFCRENGIHTDIQRVPSTADGWEPPGLPLDVAFAELAKVVELKRPEKRVYLPVAQIEESRRMAAEAAKELPEIDPERAALPPEPTARNVRLSEQQQRENERCIDFFRYAFVAWNGKVLSCCQERHAVGDLNLQSAEEVWNGPVYRDLRKSYFEQGICSVCEGCARILD